MPARQLQLFGIPRPLVERLGEDLFRRAPKSPGVYIMAGADGRVLYVGQSRNLRSRLATYKNARPGLATRKTLRLVHAVHSVVWETCASADEAQLRENELLRRHRPKFNSVNTYPEGYWFVWLRYASPVLELGRSHELTRGAESFGAFKSGVAQMFASLLRLIWAGLHQPPSLCQCPVAISGSRPPRSYSFQFPVAVSSEASLRFVEELRSFLRGVSGRLPDELGGLWTPETPFDRALQTSDLEALKVFFNAGPRSNHEMFRRGAVAGPLIPQAALDDLTVIRKSNGLG